MPARGHRIPYVILPPVAHLRSFIKLLVNDRQIVLCCLQPQVPTPCGMPAILAAASRPSSPKMSPSYEGVSQRSHKLMKGPLSYFGTFMKAQSDLWSEGNPEGWIPLVVAENKLGNNIVLEKIGEVQEFPTWVMNYNNMKGVPQLQHALARLLEHTFVKGVTINPDHMYIASGCSAVIDNTFWILCDEGDGVIIPAPYYPAFDNDLTAKNALHPLPFYLEEGPSAAPVEEQLDSMVSDAASRGIPVKALLVTNPNNPLGTIYPDSTLTSMIAWCLRHKIHMVSDEIYACSIFKPAPITSAITLAQQLVHPTPAQHDAPAGAAGTAAGLTQRFSQREVDTYVHLMYGLSKDWCGSGLRVGMLYSRNQALHQALNSVCLFTGVSNWVSHSLSLALSDLKWADEFIARNKRLLETSYDTLTGALQEEGIPFLPAVGGMFVWMDLRQWLPADSWEGEQQLWDAVCDRSKIILTPGEACHAPAPGYFRLCFAWLPPAALSVAVHRLGRQLKGE